MGREICGVGAWPFLAFSTSSSTSSSSAEINSFSRRSNSSSSLSAGAGAARTGAGCCGAAVWRAMFRISGSELGISRELSARRASMSASAISGSDIAGGSLTGWAAGRLCLIFLKTLTGFLFSLISAPLIYIDFYRFSGILIIDENTIRTAAVFD